MQPIAQTFPALLRRLHNLPCLTLPVWRALWNANVGPAVAARTMVSRYQDGTLIVLVNHSAWRQPLMRLKPDLIATLNLTAGKSAVKDIEFVYSEKWAKEDSKRKNTHRPVEPPPLFDDSFLNLESVQDPEIRQWLLETARRYFTSSPRRPR